MKFWMKIGVNDEDLAEEDVLCTIWHHMFVLLVEPGPQIFLLFFCHAGQFKVAIVGGSGKLLLSYQRSISNLCHQKLLMERCNSQA